MNFESKECLEAEGIFLGKPSKQDLISYFMKQQRLATIKKLEENDRDQSPELSESFEIYLEQKKQKIEIEKQKLKSEGITSENSANSKIKNHSDQFSVKEDSIYEKSFNDESFLELEKLCENTLNLNNVSEVLTDLTTLDISSNTTGLLKTNLKEETCIFEIEQPSFLMNNNTSFVSPENSPTKFVHKNRPSTIVEVTELSLSYKTTQSHCQSLQSTEYTDNSEYYQTAMDKTIGSQTSYISKNDDDKFDESFQKEKFNDSNLIEKNSKHSPSLINDTLDEIDFLLSQAQKMNDDKELKTVKIDKLKQNHIISPFKSITSPGYENKVKLVKTLKRSPLITFSPATNNSPSNFKCPKQPVSSNKTPNLSKINNKKFQHIVSPVSRYIQTSESVLNKNARVQYEGSSKRYFNFRDSENFNKTVDNSVKITSLPLRAKTKNLDTRQINHQYKTSEKGKPYSNTLDIFVNNTFNDSEVNERKLADLSLLSENTSSCIDHK